MLTFSTSKGPVATARGSVTMELLLLQPTLTFNYARLRSPHRNPLPKERELRHTSKFVGHLRKVAQQLQPIGLALLGMELHPGDVPLRNDGGVLFYVVGFSQHNLRFIRSAAVRMNEIEK